jgi:hypothetical protein
LSKLIPSSAGFCGLGFRKNIKLTLFLFDLGMTFVNPLTKEVCVLETWKLLTKVLSFNLLGMWPPTKTLFCLLSSNPNTPLIQLFGQPLPLGLDLLIGLLFYK